MRLLTRYKYRKQLGFYVHSIVLISVAELIPRKNHEVILRAISGIKDFDVKYLIVDIGELEEYQKNLCNELHISDKVHFLGYRNDIKELNWSSDICVFPSRIEGLGMAAIEAMACALPIVTSNIHGVNDYSKDGVTGLKAASDDVEGFRKA
ncbi:MAG: glycosyltransferase family 4 protein, partial [Bilifractor sp.]|nr:glycosyltransferase family 4 protein [Bilifractor sp.]